jgi:hypothetical protein
MLLFSMTRFFKFLPEESSGSRFCVAVRRCQSCGAMSNFDVHQKEFTSLSRRDSDEHPITLCNTCRACVHPRQGVGRD